MNPVFNADFRYEIVDDGQIQDEPVHFKVMDKDEWTADDNIGVVHVDINSILVRAGHSSNSDDPLQIAGWFPIYDTLEGIRGELYLVIKLDFIVDINKFDNASTEVEFFAVSDLDPAIYNVSSVIGLVDELIVAKDPDYEFADNFRHSRVSNEKRQNWMVSI